MPGLARGILKHLRKKLILFSPCYLQGIPMGSLKKKLSQFGSPVAWPDYIYYIYERRAILNRYDNY